MSNIDKFYPFVGVEPDYNYAEESELPIPCEMRFDFDSKQVVIDEKGNVELVTGIEALKVWCYFAIMTQRFEWLIMSDSYGSEHRILTGQGYSRALSESEAFRYIKEALMENAYITDVENKGVYFKGDTLYINILVKTIYGEVIVNAN